MTLLFYLDFALFSLTPRKSTTSFVDSKNHLERLHVEEKQNLTYQRFLYRHQSFLKVNFMRNLIKKKKPLFFFGKVKV